MNPLHIISTFILLTVLDLGIGQENGCVTLREGDQSFTENVEYVPMAWYETPAIVSSAPACTGEEALGLANFDVTNQQMTASSFSRNHEPGRGRLNLAAGRGKKGAWCSRTNNEMQYLQVDFWRNVKITKFETQGRQDYGQWVTSYKLAYAMDGEVGFQTYQENDVDKVFTGNSDRNTVVTHVLLQPIRARSVKIMPTANAWEGRISMRAEFYGCVLTDRYQVIGRKVHMDFVKEYLTAKKNVDFGDSQELPNNIELEILADTVYVKVR
ncbi:EGF-like repeat and discoidin I-like domain-containing protein 3 [Oculina patagonica]